VDAWLPHLDAALREAATRRWASDPGGFFTAYTRGELAFADQRRLRSADLQTAFGGAVLDDEAYARWDAGYEQAFRGAWRAADDALGLLDALAAAGLPYGALTNMAGEYQRAKLDAVGLARVPVLVAMDDLGRGKPDPAVFRLACRRLGTDPHRTVYVGDELDVDARGARDAGLLGVWLDRHRTGAEPDDVLVVRSLGDLVALLTPARAADAARDAAGKGFGDGDTAR
jgi:putative hydrolase of the HAD superfamily